MPENGVKTANFTKSDALDEVLGNRNGTTVRQSLDSLAIQLAVKASFTRNEAVACATTANITLSGEQTIDDVTTSASRVLVKDQTVPAENGIYVTASGAWARASDMDAAGKVQGAAVYVTGGTVGAGKTLYTGSEVTTIGADAIAWVIAEDQSGIKTALEREIAEKLGIDAYHETIEQAILSEGWQVVFLNEDGTRLAGGFRQDANGLRFVPLGMLLPEDTAIDGAPETVLADRLVPPGVVSEDAKPESGLVFAILSEDGTRLKFAIPDNDDPIFARVTDAVLAEGVADGAVTVSGLAPDVVESLVAGRYVAELDSGRLTVSDLATGSLVEIAAGGASEPEIIGGNVAYTHGGARVWRPADGSKYQAPLASGLTSIVHYGDSLTAASAGVGSLGAVLGVPSINRGVGGWSVNDVATRAGAVDPLITLTGNELPASGSVLVTDISPATGWSPYVDVTLFGTILGEPVTMFNDVSAGTRTITRDTPGTALSVPAGTPFISSENATYKEHCQTIWVGRNAVTSATFIADTLAAVAALVDHLSPLAKRYVVIGVTNGTGETSDTADYAKIVSLNEQLAEIYGPYFYDLRRDFIDEGLARAGISPTAGDTANIAADAPPPSLMADAVHPTSPTGYNVQRDLVAEWLQAKGWF
ncbi:hypothetical protein HKX23_17480 [Sulfitobacter sp. KE29]|uniref:hypothetical protein n=1 Tax=unclassified Sulfitobacter TaxID=196795 RepID=UPI0023E180F1|nr:MULTISPECIES: hypothetical protein [unclassified Sulfitobacter]MDF3420143.1 hypothetical protein [Sulfitobacter sp. Ks38]MDF3427628.1 hypothetical protein [Sulfitobacter sp. KE29]MDF3431207.1 hypothetical protein [Sulfitobacter sp. S46]MDF3445980.1 hypothetical protein [Sulfitobacter sp. KE31]MDF3549989.1 hypothetical protein [Sulfitobacter sp. KE28]